MEAPAGGSRENLQLFEWDFQIWPALSTEPHWRLKGDPVKGLPMLQEVRSEMFDAGYIAPLLGVDIPYGAAIALAGKMRTGVRWIKDSIERFAELGNKTQPALGRLVLGEIYLQMALGENKPPMGIVIRNLGFILTSMPFAARNACQYREYITFSKVIVD